MKEIIVYCLLISLILLSIGCDRSGTPNSDNEIDTVQAVKSVDEEIPGSFFFVGNYYGKPAIYNYDLIKNNWKVIWANQREPVINLSYSRDNRSIFFLTAGKYGKKGNLPFVNRIKLYRVDPDSVKGKFIRDVGSGIQVLAQWNYDGNFEVILSSIDKTIAQYVNVNKQVYNTFGKLVDDKIETYDLTKDGFPNLVPARISKLSDSGNYGLSESGDSLFLRTLGVDSLKFIVSLLYDLNKIRWSSDEAYAFFSTRVMEEKSLQGKDASNSELFVYNVNADSITVHWHGEGIKNFVTIGDLLIFDDGFDWKSSIQIYNYRMNELIGSIKISGGCGLAYIPGR